MIQQEFTLGDLPDHVRQAGTGVVSTVSTVGHPEAAFMERAVTADGRSSSSPARTPGRPSTCAPILVGWERGITVQVEGLAEAPSGTDREELARLFEGRFPGASARIEDFALFRVRPSWARYNDTDPESYCVIETTWTGPEGS